MRVVLVAMIGLAASAHKLSHDSIWDDMIGGVDEKTYNKETPKDYKEPEKPKIDK